VVDLPLENHFPNNFLTIQGYFERVLAASMDAASRTKRLVTNHFPSRWYCHLKEPCMISENCSLEEFVETVKGRETWEVLSQAIDEATRADRMFMRSHQHTGKALLCGQTYARQLKQLINYLRYTVKPRRPENKAYRLYMAHWGNV
jgi:hypothetical protein